MSEANDPRLTPKGCGSGEVGGWWVVGRFSLSDSDLGMRWIGLMMLRKRAAVNVFVFKSCSGALGLHFSFDQRKGVGIILFGGFFYS